MSQPLRHRNPRNATIELTGYFQVVKSVHGCHLVTGLAFEKLLVHALLDLQVQILLIGSIAVLLGVDEPPFRGQIAETQPTSCVGDTN